MTESVPVSPPTVAWQVYCPPWDWRSGLMMRMYEVVLVLVTVKSPPVTIGVELPGLVHCTVGIPKPLTIVTSHVRVYCRPSVGFGPAVVDTITIVNNQVKSHFHILKGRSICVM